PPVAHAMFTRISPRTKGVLQMKRRPSRRSVQNLGVPVRLPLSTGTGAPDVSGSIAVSDSASTSDEGVEASATFLRLIRAAGIGMMNKADSRNDPAFATNEISYPN